MDAAGPGDTDLEDAAPAGAAPKEGAPHLDLPGFSGPLDRLLALARAQRIALDTLPLGDLVDQLAPAFQQATSLAERGDWVVMAAWLLLLRSRLLLPHGEPDAAAARQQAARLRGQLLRLQEVQALAGWLDRRPRLGRDVFARGQPETLGSLLAVQHEVDVVEFLWASLELFETGEGAPDTVPRYQPVPPGLHTVADARSRILQRLAPPPEALPLQHFLPDAQPDAAVRRRAVLAKSRWTSVLTASLELAKDSRVVLEQEDAFGAVTLALRANRPAAE